MALALVGCAPEDVGQTNVKPPTEEEIAKEIARIEADPNMPPQAKAMAIQQLKQGGSGQKTMGSTKQ